MEIESLPADRFLDRELSWLAFNQRVLELAEDHDLPCLERAKFLAIFAGNLDEFFMVRVAGLKRRIATGIAVRAASGLSPREVLENIWERSHELQRQHAHAFRDDIMPSLSGAGIALISFRSLRRLQLTHPTPFRISAAFPSTSPSSSAIRSRARSSLRG